uniref:PROP1-like PPR domain-containing protein n=1 Tax=Glossina pallidipes TaxID=7398 RepID=A0A1B0ABF4_GLOPL
MASILRSGKLLRHFTGVTRNLIVNTVRDTESSTLLQKVPCMLQYQQGFANGVSGNVKTDLTLDDQLRRLDKDLRRMGRISRQDLEDVLEEIRANRSATSSQSLMVIRCCGNLVPEEMPEVRTALVQEIWKTFNSINVPMDISHYNALLRVYLENEHQFSPTDFLAELESKSLEPNRVTYQRLVARYCQQGDIDGATRILEFMRAKNLPVNEAVFNSLILGHSQANDMESAKGILGVMKQAGVELGAETYATLMCCYAKHGDLESIQSCLAECEKKEILLIDKDMLDIIYHLTVNGHGDKIDILLSKFHRSMGFNQECVNVILRLVNKGYEDVCLKLLKIMPRNNRPNGQPVDVGSFFIRQMVKANRPIEKVLNVCNLLKEEGLNAKGLLIAAEAGLMNGAANNALLLLQEMKKSGLPIRQHYFWPLICSSKPNEMMNILQKMQTDFKLTLNGETLRDYVIPSLKEENWDKVISFLREAGIPTGTAAAAASFVALTNHQIGKAANIMQSHQSIYNGQLFRGPLLQAFANTENYDAFVRCLRQLLESEQKRTNATGVSLPSNKEAVAATEKAEDLKESEQNLAGESEESELGGEAFYTSDVVGDLILDVVSYYRSKSVGVLENLLPKLVEEGFTISNGYAARLSEKLGSNMNPNISQLLAKLSSGELELKPLSNTQKKRSVDTLSVEELERFIANVEAKGENSQNLKRLLLNACFRSKNLEKTLEVMKNLENENFQIGSGIYAQLIDLYVYHDRIEDALAVYQKVKAKEPNFLLDNLKTVGVAEMLLKQDRFEDALNFLEKNKKETVNDLDTNYNYTSRLWRMLNALADSANVEKLQKVFDTLVGGNYVIPNNVLLGPLIKVHLVRDDIPKAMQAFEKICDEYKSTPWKNELARRLIQTEDATNLQKLTDLSTNIHGEINSLYDLVFSFVECGRIRQARKILETPGLRVRPHRIDTACERYKNEGMVESLEGLVEATKDLNHIDRDKIYYTLLLSYCKIDDVNKALGLWTKMQEEDVTPSDAFLLKLAKLLESKNMKIPFSVPTVKQEQNVETKTKVKAEEESPKKSQDMRSTNVSKHSMFRKTLNGDDVEAMIAAKYQLNSSEPLSISDLSRFIEQLVKVNRLTEATKCVNEMLDNKRLPLLRVLKFYLNRIASSGDLETMKKLDNQLSEEQKRKISFDNRYCNAITAAGKTEEYLKILSDQLANAKTPEEIAKFAAKFPRGGALGMLEKHPEVLPQFEKLAESYAAHKHLGPVNMLWIHFLSQGDIDRANNVWSKYLSNAPRLMFQRVLQTAREQNDEKLAQTVVDQLRGSKISEGAIGNAYSCLIDIQCSKGNNDKALEIVKTAVKDICLENINRTALQNLKAALEAEGKKFPYTIPEKRSKAMSSSSSHSSDDDVSPTRPETRPPKPQNEKSKDS